LGFFGEGGGVGTARRGLAGGGSAGIGMDDGNGPFVVALMADVINHFLL
jgi:hypothetical protein